jgi:WD40 repeat protein
MSNEDPLELEHMIGYTGQHAASVQFHPTEPETVVCFIGRLVVISNVLDPHQQEFLRGHEEEITALTISPSGNYLASGQVSSVRVPNSEAKVIVWDFKTRQPVYSLIDLNDGNAFSQNRVVQLAFSSDEAFLAGCDDQRGCKLCVWKTQTGELEVLAGKQPQLAFLQWGRKLQGAKKHASYELYTGSNSKVVQQLLEHDPRTMQYKLSGSAMQMPSSGLSRDYYCAQMHGGYDYIVTGSSSGEMCVFNTNTLVFRACVPVSCGGVHALVTCVLDSPDGGARAIAYCGCGDGHLKMLAGQDLSWEMLGETALSGKIVALSISADGASLLAGTSDGNIYLLDAATLEIRAPTGSGAAGAAERLAVDAAAGPWMASHINSIRCLASAGDNERYITGATNGVLRMWELSYYKCVFEAAPHVEKGAHAHVLVVVQDGLVAGGGPDPRRLVSGWTNGQVMVHDLQGRELWQMAAAHRGGVTALAVSDLYILSGGADGTLRVWNPATREAVTQFVEHKGAVSAVVVDVERKHLVHSCGADKSVVTVDLKQNRRVLCHSARPDEGKLTHMVQSELGEQELLTADNSGSVKWWDDCEAEPVSMIVTWPASNPEAEKRINCVDLSPPAAAELGGKQFLLVSTAAGHVQVWETEETRLVSVGDAHSHEVSAAVWSPDGRQIISTGLDACICVWNFFGA